MKQNNIHQNNPWDVLHKQERFKPVYPLDHVVRFVFTYFPRNREQRKKLKLLDVGCGAGRHVVLLSQEGFQAYGTDISLEGVRAARDWLKSENLPALVEQAEMSVQPFHDNIFDGIICSGVLNYNTISGMKKTIAELHRILKPLGIMAVITRTIDDYRFGKGTKIEEHTYQLDIDDTNEKGMIMHFLDDAEIMDFFNKFEVVSIEKTETTFSNRMKKNSDWIVILRKKDDTDL